jgi:hypothetical protein
VESEVAGREAPEAATEVKSRMEAALYEIKRVIASWCIGSYRSISVHAGSLRDAVFKIPPSRLRRCWSEACDTLRPAPRIQQAVVSGGTPGSDGSSIRDS